MAIKKNLMKTPIKPDPMELEELRFNLGLSDSILKIYPVFDLCKSWGSDVIPRSVGARGTMSINKYLPYPTYIHLGDL